MTMTRESEFFLKIEIYNSNKQKPVFRWLREGNIALGCDVANQFISQKIPEQRENQYSVYISMNKARRENGNTTIYERGQQVGNVREAIMEFQSFLNSKFGFPSTQKHVADAISQ